jgi:hypothetical protein
MGHGNMGHGRGCRGTVPMLFTRQEPDYITRPNFLDKSAVALNPAAASLTLSDPTTPRPTRPSLYTLCFFRKQKSFSVSRRERKRFQRAYYYYYY